MDTDTTKTRKHAHGLARKVAEHLPGWQYDIAANMNGEVLDHYPRLDPKKTNGAPKDERRCLYFDTRYGIAKPGQFHVHGRWPYHHGHGVVCPDGSPKGINVSMSKTAERIAQDIKRRYLPEYERTHAEARTKLQNTRDYESQCAAVALRLADLLGSTVNPHDHSRIRVYGNGEGEAGDPRIDVEYAYADSVKLQINCTPDDAERIINAVQRLPA